MLEKGFIKGKADKDRLYIDRIKGGRGIRSVENIVKYTEQKLKDYINKGSNKILTNIAQQTNEITAIEYKQQIEKQYFNNWMQKPLHSQFFKQLPDNIDKKLTYAWLKNNIKSATEALITSAQDQGLPTRSLQSKFKDISPTCRLCGEKPETPLHILAECSSIAGTDYKYRHDRVAKIIHYKILKSHQIETCKQYYKHDPQDVTEDDNVKVLWDFNIYTDKKISARRPDIVVIHKCSKTGFIIDINCPNDKNVARNERDKVTKYIDLSIELERLWKVKFKIIPIVIGCLGTVTNKALTHASTLGLTESDLKLMQREALFGSAHILRRYITQGGEHWQ